MSDEPRVVVCPVSPSRDGRGLEIGRTLGAGGMGVVQEGFDQALQRRLAVKALHPFLEPDRSARMRFIEEAQITSQLDHPNIVPVYELGEHPGGGLYFTMKRVEGETLTDRLAAMPPVNRTPGQLYELLQVLMKVCDAVAFAHSRGVIHRDLKPDNIMVGRFGQVYLMDWGIAKLQGRPDPESGSGGDAGRTLPALTADGVALGTPTYMSPEQASGDSSRIDERSDVFALGAVLYQILTNEPPFGENRPLRELLKAIDECAVLPPQARTEAALPPRLCAITMKALAKRPAERQQCVADLKSEIERFLQSGWQFPLLSFAAGAVIVREGSFGDSAYVIVTGSCVAYRGDGAGRRELRRMGRGEVFGETAVFGRQQRTASVAAAEPTTLLEISRRTFEEELGMGFWMGLFVKALAERFAEKEARVAELEAELEALKG